MSERHSAMATTNTNRGLDGLPVLGRGQHAAPEQGACFMEYASLLAGADFSDHPRCTHPLLAQVARMVNDALDDENRQRIAPLVPDVISIRNPMAQVTAELVAQLTAQALQHDPNSRRLAQLHRRAVRRSNAVGLRRRAVALSEPMYRTGTASQAVALCLRTLASRGPSALRQALEGAVAAARHAAGAPSPVGMPVASIKGPAVRTP